jgi:hypothetical protein
MFDGHEFLGAAVLGAAPTTYGRNYTERRYQHA